MRNLLLVLWVVVACGLAGCESRAEKDFKQLVDQMCACEDQTCVQQVQDEGSSTRSLFDLADPAVFEARFGDDQEMMDAQARMVECSARFTGLDPGS